MARIITDGTAYANLSQVDTSPTQRLGEKVQADSGIYLYGQAGAAIDAGEAVSFEVTETDCQLALLVNSAAGLSVGVACEDLADNEYGWVWCGGEGGYEEALVATTISDNTALTATATAGTLGSGGQAVIGAYAAESSGSGGITACRSTTILRT